MDEPLDLKKVAEAALFIAGKHLSDEELAVLLSINSNEVPQVLNALQADYDGRDSPIIVTRREDGAWKLELQTEYLSKVSDLAPQMDMTRAMLTTLSYIAYKQPVKQSVIVHKFGNRIYDYVKELIKRGLINTEPKGHTKMLTTSNKLFEYLGVEDATRVKEAMDKARLAREVEKKEQELGKAGKKKKASKKPVIPKKNLTADDWMGISDREKEDEDLKMLEKMEAELEKALDASGDDEFETQ